MSFRTSVARLQKLLGQGTTKQVHFTSKSLLISSEMVFFASSEQPNEFG